MFDNQRSCCTMLTFQFANYNTKNLDEKACQIKLSKMLVDRGYAELERFENNDEAAFNQLYKENICIYIFTASILEKFPDLAPMIRLRNSFLNNGPNKFFIPLFMSDVDDGKIPSLFLNRSQFLGLRDSSEILERFAAMIDLEVRHQFNLNQANLELSKEVIKNIKLSAPQYIDATLHELKKREKTLRYFANFYFVSGFLLILIGLISAIIFYRYDYQTPQNENWNQIIYFTLRSLIIITLMLAASKYSFTLAKSYMQESLKISDRIHAISFGQFYLNVYENIAPSDLKEIFRDWNISNISTAFYRQQADEFDPKLFDKIQDIIKAVQNKN